MDTLLYTIAKRPYVFAFLITYLFLSIRAKGVKKTFLYLGWGYLVAFLSEASSIRNGFPYGWYFYIYENLKGELLLAGVPVWDSLSYVFMTFAGLSCAEFLFFNPLKRGKLILSQWRSKNILNSSLGRLFIIAFSGACLTTLLDVVIDPVAHMGDRWFLGNIYYYPNPGTYFNVPMSNFLGWIAVSFMIIFPMLILEKKTASTNHHQEMKSSLLLSLIDSYGGLGLYFGIFAFNGLITAWLGEYKLLACDLFWIAIPATLAIKAAVIARKHS